MLPNEGLIKQLNTAISCEHLLSLVRSQRDLHLWITFKHLDNDNAVEYYRSRIELDKQPSLKHRL